MNKDISISYKSRRAYVWSVRFAHRLYAWGFFPDKTITQVRVHLPNKCIDHNEYALMERLLNVLDKYEYFINVWVGRANAGLNEEEYERFDLVDNRHPVYIYNETERYEVVFK